MKIRINLVAFLLILFIFLKLVGAINWSWWWVTSPFWLPFALYLAIVGILLVYAVLKTIINGLFNREDDY